MKNERVLTLILYSRQGCCLCAGLEQRLKELPLSKVKPPINLDVIDIDSENVSPKERARFSLEVPVLFVVSDQTGQLVELPRVSPRLKEEGLFRWLKLMLTKAIGTV